MNGHRRITVPPAISVAISTKASAFEFDARMKSADMVIPGPMAFDPAGKYKVQVQLQLEISSEEAVQLDAFLRDQRSLNLI